MSNDGPLGAFEEVVLLAVIRKRDDAYGMEVRREIERLTERDVAIGAVYATLDRLEAKRLVASARTRGAGISRRLFRVTREAVTALAETRDARDRLWRGVRLESVMPQPERP